MDNLPSLKKNQLTGSVQDNLMETKENTKGPFLGGTVKHHKLNSLVFWQKVANSGLNITFCSLHLHTLPVVWSCDRASLQLSRLTDPRLKTWQMRG